VEVLAQPLGLGSVDGVDGAFEPGKKQEP
jgi:hypothetical protein